jgi:hypothetical protein
MGPSRGLGTSAIVRAKLGAGRVDPVILRVSARLLSALLLSMRRCPAHASERAANSRVKEAADRLTELAAEGGDLDTLQRMVDEGNENAADRLSELIRKIK